jgi:hypothetical protein
VVAADLLALAGLASVQRLPNEAELPALEEVS